MKEVTIYTDGACSGNPGPGGWGAVLIYGEVEKEICGGERNTTNNRMELRAVIEALTILKESCHIHLYTDSQYVMNGIKEWISKWKANGWRSANRKPVKNEDLWRLLDEAVTRHTISWNWVRGHAGNVNNERADALARRGMEEIRIKVC